MSIILIATVLMFTPVCMQQFYKEIAIFNPVASIKYQSDWGADQWKSEASPYISMNFEWPTFVYKNILNMRIMILCHRNEKKINQKFVWLKVA